ncbi:hypothetical protein [Fusobacterium animalis]|uniref:hypothetical protein n=1 Tax=Fusobacterium animalis TaxID=76859 RepID=UPI0030CDFF4E
MEKKYEDNTIESEILKNVKDAIDKIEKKFYNIISVNGREESEKEYFVMNCIIS